MSDMSALAEIMQEASAEMAHSLTTIRKAIAHNLSKGEAAEEAVRRFLRDHLPASLGIASGEIIDSQGGRSKQIDVIIYDMARTPILFSSDEQRHRLVPSEGVIAAIEVKAHVDATDVPGIIKHMTSVKKLDKSAYYPWGMIQESTNIYGTTKDYFPTLYFLLAFDSGGLEGINKTFVEQHAHLPVEARVDCVCILSKGLLVNRLPAGLIDCTSTPDATFASYETSNALLLFYILITRYLLQAKIRPIDLQRYIPRDFAY